QVTFGVKHEFRSFSLGAFYRYGASSVSDSRSSANPFQNFNNTLTISSVSGKSQAHSSEIGFRARGAISNRLFYGTEGTLLFRNSRNNLVQFNIPDLTVNSSESSATRRLALGLGLGYLWRPRTIFSFDVSGGLIRNKSNRYEDLTGNLLETRAGDSGFLSAQAVVQTDVWRNLFVSASILSLSQSGSTDSRLFADRFGRRLNSAGIVTPDGIMKSFDQNFYSNYSIGWRFKPNFIFQYTLTTDYGQSNLRHSFLFRYDFNFSRD
ncbi:MAG TPA: hypothetical protein VGP58_09135, partial [Pyrinomonadaceae bacterium]|nr:hypothetical protein [Pyrinomonadaceae bacterium]